MKLLCPVCRRVHPQKPGVKGHLAIHTDQDGRRCPWSGKPGWAKPGQKKCKRCGKERWFNRKGLCGKCFKLAGSEHAPLCRRGVGVEGDGRLPAIPTDAQTVQDGGHYATERKLAILSLRAERGESLFHPGDARRCLA